MESSTRFEPYASYLIARKIAHFCNDTEDVVVTFEELPNKERKTIYIKPHKRFIYSWLRVQAEILCNPNYRQSYDQLISLATTLRNDAERQKYRSLYKEWISLLRPYLAFIEHYPPAQSGDVLFTAKKDGLYDRIDNVEFRNF